MYFINARKKLSSSAFLLHLLPAGTVFFAMIGLTLLGWRNAQDTYKAEQRDVIQQVSANTSEAIQRGLATNELLLAGASGLFDASTHVSRADWKKYTASFDLENNYPGVQGIGYVVNATPETLPDLITSAKNEGYKDFSVFPAGKRDAYSILWYYEPLNVAGLGFDYLSDPLRREAILKTSQTGQSAITPKLQFVRNKNELGSVGFIVLKPVYTDAGQRDIKDPAQRSIRGYVFVPLMSNAFFTQTLEHAQHDNFSIKIYDKSQGENNVLYETPNHNELERNSFNHTANLSVDGRDWVLDYRFSQEIIDSNTRARPASSLILGAFLSLLLSGFVLTLLVARTRVLAHSKQTEVQSAKDELLSLASHQLRTPATSVKQYLGMTLEGFAGKLSSQQRNLLEKAYESNERQLRIINEILYVAKIDAKGIVLTPRRINLNKLLRDLTQELSSIAKKSQQKVRLHMPLKQIYIEADEHCLRMAIENLISNALKYSHEGSTTYVKMTAQKNTIKIVVKDHGVGIDAEDLPQLFQRFSRIPNELSRQTSGSGIGLYLSQQLVELHHGSIAVESSIGKGTTFTVTLPRKYNRSDAGEAGV